MHQLGSFKAGSKIYQQRRNISYILYEQKHELEIYLEVEFLIFVSAPRADLSRTFLSLSQSSRPTWWALVRWQMLANASTGCPFSRRSSFTRSDSWYLSCYEWCTFPSVITNLKMTGEQLLLLLLQLLISRKQSFIQQNESTKKCKY